MNGTGKLVAILYIGCYIIFCILVAIVYIGCFIVWTLSLDYPADTLATETFLCVFGSSVVPEWSLYLSDTIPAIFSIPYYLQTIGNRYWFYSGTISTGTIAIPVLNGLHFLLRYWSVDCHTVLVD